MTEELNTAMEDLVLRKTSTKRYSVFYKDRLLCIGWKHRTTFSRKYDAKRKLASDIVYRISLKRVINDIGGLYKEIEGYIEEQIRLGNIEIKLMGE